MAAAGSRLPHLHKRIKLTKAERKMRKKQSKALHTLKSKASEVGELSDIPTPYLLVKNGGLVCGIKRRDLIDVFDVNGKLEDLIMLPGKSYSYALFSDAVGSEEAMKNINGQKILNPSPIAGRRLYLAYLLHRPCTDLCFSNKSCPPGMVLIEDFISESLESDLLQYFSSGTNLTGHSEVGVTAEQQLKHRYVKHYGYEFIYGSNDVKESPLRNGIPSECAPVVEKLVSLDCVKHKPDQLTINEYQPGQGIPPHVDTHSAFEDGIISLSLGAMVAMDFRHPDGRHVSVLLPRRSVLIMTGECRYVWAHGITPRKFDVVNENDVTKDKEFIAKDSHSSTQHSLSPESNITLLPREVRLSLTFRKVRHASCDCKYPGSCDSQTYSSRFDNDIPRSSVDAQVNCNKLPHSEEEAVDLEQEHVHNVYESIAEHFSGTRHSPWPKVAAFLKEQSPGSIVADVGCGNGKYLGINDQLFMVGSDRSQNLATICRERGYHVIVSDILSLPYRSNSFDVCICIAVIHHLSTEARRVAAIKELVRIIRTGGRILISVWALEQNLKKQEKEKSGKELRKCLQTANNAWHDAKQVGEQGFDHGDELSVITSKEEDHLINSVSNTIDNVRLNDNIDQDTNVSSHRPNESLRHCRAQLSGESMQGIDASSVGHAQQTAPGSSNAARSQSFSTVDTEVPVQGVFSKRLPHCSTKECSPSSGSAGKSESGLLELKVNASRGVFEQQDLLVPWHYQGNKARMDKLSSVEEEKVPKVYQRFYHVYRENELVNECRQLDDVSIVRNYYDKGNWCVVLEKILL